MRMAFGLAGLLVTIGVIAWIMHAVYLPDTEASLAAQKKMENTLNQINGQDNNGVRMEDSYKVFADSRDDGKLLDLQVTEVMPGGPMDAKYGLRTNDVIIAAIDGHTVRTDFAGLNSQEEGTDAIRDAFTTGGQLVVERGNQKITLPLSPTPVAPAQPNTLSANAQKTEQQQEGKTDHTEDGTMDQIKLHALPGF